MAAPTWRQGRQIGFLLSFRLRLRTGDCVAAWIRVSPSRWVVLAAVSLPLAELAIFVALVVKVGLLATLALMVATTALGIFLLRWAGRGQIAQIRVGPDGIAG